ncbi:hypothetical protein Trydic_g18751 [Trypoxylus dichotomus]
MPTRNHQEPHPEMAQPTRCFSSQAQQRYFRLSSLERSCFCRLDAFVVRGGNYTTVTQGLSLPRAGLDSVLRAAPHGTPRCLVPLPNSGAATDRLKEASRSKVEQLCFELPPNRGLLGVVSSCVSPSFVFRYR